MKRSTGLLRNFSLVVTLLFFTALPASHGAISFVQLTDPHLFDKVGREADIADSQEAFSSCITTMNGLNLRRHFEFAVITGDIGIENFNPNCDSNRWKAAVKFFAEALEPSDIHTWLFVPGNNDIADENPTNIWIYNRFIEDVQKKLPSGFTIIDLCPFFSTNPPYSRTTNYDIGRCRFLGFNDSCFKGNHNSNTPALFHTNQMAYINQVSNLLTTNFNYIFYHIPEIDDPGAIFDKGVRKNVSASKGPFGINDEVFRAWTVSNDVRAAWSDVTANTNVKALITGHFHSDQAICYTDFKWLANTDYGSLTNLHPQKLFIAPPISVKFQAGKKQQARGFRTYLIDNNGNISSEIIWYGFQKDPPTIVTNTVTMNNPISLQLISTGAFQARVMVDPIRIDLSNSVQIVSCCYCTNDSNRANKEQGRDLSLPRFSEKGPHGLLWGLPVLCILLAGISGRPLGRYLGIIAPLNIYDEQREAFRKWIVIKLRDIRGQESDTLKEWLGSEKPLPNRNQDYHKVRNNLYFHYNSNTGSPPPPDVLTQLRELENALAQLPFDPTKTKDLAAGLVAAMLTPVALSFSSNTNKLFVAAADDPYSLMTFFGVCLLAAMLGTDYSSSILRRIRELYLPNKIPSELPALTQKKLDDLNRKLDDLNDKK